MSRCPGRTWSAPPTGPARRRRSLPKAVMCWPPVPRLSLRLDGVGACRCPSRTRRHIPLRRSSSACSPPARCNRGRRSDAAGPAASEPTRGGPQGLPISSEHLSASRRDPRRPRTPSGGTPPPPPPSELRPSGQDEHVPADQPLGRKPLSSRVRALGRARLEPLQALVALESAAASAPWHRYLTWAQQLAAAPEVRRLPPRCGRCRNDRRWGSWSATGETPRG